MSLSVLRGANCAELTTHRLWLSSIYMKLSCGNNSLVFHFICQSTFFYNYTHTYFHLAWNSSGHDKFGLKAWRLELENEPWKYCEFFLNRKPCWCTSSAAKAARCQRERSSCRKRRYLCGGAKFFNLSVSNSWSAKKTIWTILLLFFLKIWVLCRSSNEIKSIFTTRCMLFVLVLTI